MSYIVVWYAGWDEHELPFPSYDSAMAFVEGSGIDPDEFDLIEDECPDE